MGKSSVVNELRRICPEVFLSVSITTRPPRPGEVEGRQYHFVDSSTFERMAAAGQLLEHAEYAGNRYGTPREPVEAALAAGRPAVLEIEVQGARQVRKSMPDAQLVMVLPPSWEVLVSRLRGRGTEDADAVARRLAVAERELAAAEEFDALVVNTDLRDAARELLALVVGNTHG